MTPNPRSSEPSTAARSGLLPPAIARVAGWSERTLSVLVWGLTGVVVVLVAVLMRGGPLFEIDGLDVSGLPAFHATLNLACAVLLVFGVWAVQRGKITAHRSAMMGAFLLSTVFLLSYVTYHAQVPSTPFGGEGWIRPVYFFILITHIVLAPVILPLALYAVLRAFRAEYGRHRQVARWTFPLWLYVAVTGVLVYLFMRPYYGG
jgi:putative membrane protein